MVVGLISALLDHEGHPRLHVLKHFLHIALLYEERHSVRPLGTR